MSATQTIKDLIAHAQELAEFIPDVDIEEHSRLWDHQEAIIEQARQAMEAIDE